MVFVVRVVRAPLDATGRFDVTEERGFVKTRIAGRVTRGGVRAAELTYGFANCSLRTTFSAKRAR